jgi:radical SAM protein with 4Fe4S-binding SPASM domain
MRSNIEELPMIVQWAQRLRVESINCKPVQVHSPEIKDEALKKNPKLAARYWAQAQELAAASGVVLDPTPDMRKITGNGFPASIPAYDERGPNRRCGEDLPILFISPEGKVKPCTMWQGDCFGDFNREDFCAIWEYAEFRKLRSEASSGNFAGHCRQCRYFFGEGTAT